MLHPDLPPAPHLLPTATETKSHSVVETKDQELVIVKALSQTATPETFPAEFSPVSVTRSAASLGENLAIGYPVQQRVVLSQNIEQKKALNDAIARGKELSQQKAQSLFDAPLQPSDTETEKSATFELTQQPIKIDFDAQQQTQQPVPSTIEFKSRTQDQPVPSNTTTEQQSQPVTPDNTIQPQNQPATPENTTQPQNQPANNPQETRRVIEVVADRQEYDEQRRTVTASGNVVVRFDGSVVDADRLQVNLDNLIAVGEGNVALTRGDQVLRGQRFTYNFLQDNGNLLSGSGDVFIPTAGRDLSFQQSTDAATTRGVQARPLSDRVRNNQPRQATSPGGVNILIGGRVDARNVPNPQPGGQVRRLRFQAARVDFYPRGWQAQDVRITNDPFSPPELELRANKVTLTRESPLVDRIKTEGQRLVFDQSTSVPIPKDEQTIDRREREVSPPIASIGYDSDQRGGLYIERGFKILNNENVSWSIAPQFFVQRAVDNFDDFPSLFGLKTRLNAVLSPQTVVEGSGLLTSFDLGDIEDNLRASLRLRQSLGGVNPHIATLEYSYRDRLYNGTLGYQTVQSSLGGVVTSPNIPLGTTGFNLRYQGGAQFINANTDRNDLLLDAGSDNGRISLSRIQGSATIDGGVTLWQGKPLPPTATEGLRYTPNPVVPYLRAIAGVTGTTSYYSNGDNQSSLIGTIGLEGQLGNFSRPFLDYTAFNISYSQGINSGLSPFLFDRYVDNKILSAGITQQLYGPFRLSFQTSINLDKGESLSTDYILEYSRRTYGISLRYNPDLALGGISFRISDFNWTGGTNPISDPSEVKPVEGGVRQDY
ncbi:DUF3769 domain-containing protein [Iningainema tapete]|uniref:DUF3769 domain-containing protein n=1 Tax=Iningainema tapete BLCC-T55 TaxID=2748662 RepID=A0A8J6XL52_9CYAN|nr:DUF3769 domain-containing protein [Iningainema tapete]MBD2775047.1 DUF3769 domain-containing protein [Iningainema tapete BLCC-T55]